MTFEMIQKNFMRGLWNKSMIKKAVYKGIITEEQYMIITSEEYEPEDFTPRDSEVVKSLENEVISLQEENTSLMLAIAEVYETMLMGGTI